MDFIEVKRIVTGKNKTQKVVSETINVKEIKTFRPWYKSTADTFDGEATLIVLYNKNRGTTHDQEPQKEDENTPTMMINEAYGDFIGRMSGRVIILGK